MLVGDYLIQKALRSGFTWIRQDPTVADQFLSSLRFANPQQFASAVQWFSQNSPTVILGWPNEPPTTLPVISVTLQQDSETDDFVGGLLDVEDEVNAAGQLVSETEGMGVLTQASFDATVYSHNIDLCVWVAFAARWALLSHRQMLNSAGLVQQHLSMADIGPDPQFDAQLIYRRTITLSGTYPAVFYQVFNHFVTDVNVYPDDPASPENPYLTQ